MKAYFTSFPKNDRLGFLNFAPHFGQSNALSLTSTPHSLQFTNAIIKFLIDNAYFRLKSFFSLFRLVGFFNGQRPHKRRSRFLAAMDDYAFVSNRFIDLFFYAKKENFDHIYLCRLNQILS
jgi:hypothetical protein